ncbi:Uncharacterized protein TCM_014879 [Theobroma cacao]|uniref:Uncharacterized protein n=1 Tax=Theobroma cacao TaxID=3641 RepID=A0A061FZY4_THECC|nr:Uncharacterized protein TCM_014879 [Theobroma cacao]
MTALAILPLRQLQCHFLSQFQLLLPELYPPLKSEQSSFPHKHLFCFASESLVPSDAFLKASSTTGMISLIMLSSLWG